ncbi:hypothetical protein [Lactococcus protaetiae]|uniref:Uncharacterized protein n=1 Tax=Lactococcus protaetiae TaxID=2592653 RepID=A0A514Z8W9_9LACT|nr:hypothetical protein [Lactococcus protaetiae]QDK71026.1 hypothetical protein FLP15_07465 [Lactococcus protaetiae]
MRTRLQELEMIAYDSDPYTTSLPPQEQLNDDAAYGEGMAMYKGYMIIPDMPGIFHSEAEVDEYLRLKEEK